MQNILSSHKLLKLFVFFLVLTACKASGEKDDNNPTPSAYDLNHPQIIKLGDKLNEISGLAYYPKDSSLFAIVDEAGVLYKIILKGDKPDVQQWHFAKHSDYEDLVLLDSTFYIMKSKGDIVAVQFITTDSVSSQEYNIPLGGKNEFESLYYDPAVKKLVMICKNCEADNKAKVSTWAFDPSTRSYDEGPYTIDAATISGLADEGKKEKRFKPSAAAVHPITGELYILSSVNKLLVIADVKGKVKETYSLDNDVYKQPEGIAFSPSGDLFISNEAAAEGLPNLLYFKYKKGVHEK
jgi:uncharacterized protein YjiK